MSQSLPSFSTSKCSFLRRIRMCVMEEILYIVEIEDRYIRNDGRTYGRYISRVPIHKKQFGRAVSSVSKGFRKSSENWYKDATGMNSNLRAAEQYAYCLGFTAFSWFCNLLKLLTTLSLFAPCIARGSHRYIPCTSICDGDQNFWSPNFALDRLILLSSTPWSLDLPKLFYAWLLIERVITPIGYAHHAHLHIIDIDATWL